MDDKLKHVAQALYKHSLGQLDLNERESGLSWQDYVPQAQTAMDAVASWEKDPRRISIVHTTTVKMPRPGHGMVGVRVEACLSWAPSTDHDGFTDIWTGGHKFTVALPFDEVDKILEQARGGEV